MDNQVVTPTSFSSANASKKTGKKSFIIFAMAAILIIVVIVVAVVLVSNNNSTVSDGGDKKEEGGYVTNSDYPPMLDLYANMHENMTIGDLDQTISKSGYGIKKDTDDDDGSIVYLTTPSSVANNVEDGEGCKYDTNYVKYVVDEEEGVTDDQGLVKRVTAIEYHECVDGADTYIMELNDGKFRNFTGTVTIDYDTKEDAILNQLSVRQK